MTSLSCSTCQSNRSADSAIEKMCISTSFFFIAHVLTKFKLAIVFQGSDNPINLISQMSLVKDLPFLLAIYDNRIDNYK